MPFVRMRMLRSWLLGLYFVAQVAGVVPLMYDHTLNIYETKPVAGHAHLAIPGNAAEPDAGHHHGMIAFHDQCCAIHLLSGPLQPFILLARNATAWMPLSAPELIALVSYHRGRLDRPPKSLPLV
jgi:hypothetical protein